jgi:hypothetical protein
MALGRRREQFQQELMVPTSALPRSPGRPFYAALNKLLAEAEFDAYVESLCEPLYRGDGRPSIPPGVYFRMLFIGYFEGVDCVWYYAAANSALPIDDVLTEVWHDSLGRAVREIQSIGGVSTTVDYGWEGARRLTTMVYPSGPGGTEREVEFAYDALDRLVEADDALGTTPIAAMEYIGSARLALLEYRNGCELDKTGGTGSTLGHGYDPNRRHVNHEWKRGSTVITSYHNTYNGTNRRTSETRSHVSPAETDSYTFDSAYRMVGFDRAGAAAASARKLDGADKMGTYSDEGTTVVTVIDGDVAEAGLNQYSSFAGSARTYNPNGSLVRTSTRRYEYDVANRLWALNDTSGGGSTTIAKYCHDALNRRVVKMEFSGGVMTAKTRFVYAGWQVVEELEADLTTTPETWNARRQYVTGSRLDDHLQMVTYSGTGSSLAVADTYYYHANSQGFVGALTDASGTRVETYESKWLGEPLSTSSVGSRYLWQGRYWDEDLEWYEFRNRNHEPATGEFTTIDPSGLWRHAQGNGYSAFGGAEWIASDRRGLRAEWNEIPNFCDSRAGKEFLAEATRKGSSAYDIIRAARYPGFWGASEPIGEAAWNTRMVDRPCAAY